MSPTLCSQALLAAALVAGCATAVVRPEASDARWASERWPGATVESLSAGRDLFVARCAGCHHLPRPDARSPDEWAAVVGEMARGARLTTAETDLVLHYLGAASQRLRSGGG